MKIIHMSPSSGGSYRIQDDRSRTSPPSGYVRVPEEVAIAGFDDLPIAAKVKPALTTVRQDRASLGKSAFLVLDGLLHGGAGEQDAPAPDTCGARFRRTSARAGI